MNTSQLRDAIAEFARAANLRIDAEADAFGLEVEGVGTVDVAVSRSGDRLLLRAAVMRAAPGDGALMTALAINTRATELGGGALGYDAEEARIVLSRLVTAPVCKAVGLMAIVTEFSDALAAIRPRLAETDTGAPAGNAETFAPDAHWLRP